MPLATRSWHQSSVRAPGGDADGRPEVRSRCPRAQNAQQLRALAHAGTAPRCGRSWSRPSRLGQDRDDVARRAYGAEQRVAAANVSRSSASSTPPRSSIGRRRHWTARRAGSTRTGRLGATAEIAAEDLHEQVAEQRALARSRRTRAHAAAQAGDRLRQRGNRSSASKVEELETQLAAEPTRRAADRGSGRRPRVRMRQNADGTVDQARKAADLDVQRGGRRGSWRHEGRRRSPPERQPSTATASTRPESYRGSCDPTRRSCSSSTSRCRRAFSTRRASRTGRERRRQRQRRTSMTSRNRRTSASAERTRIAATESGTDVVADATPTSRRRRDVADAGDVLGEEAITVDAVACRASADEPAVVEHAADESEADPRPPLRRRRGHGG